MNKLTFSRLIALISATLSLNAIASNGFFITEHGSKKADLSTIRIPQIMPYEPRKIQSGKQAYESLNKLGLVEAYAKIYGKSPQYMKDLLTKDPTSRVDALGRIFISEKLFAKPINSESVYYYSNESENSRGAQGFIPDQVFNLSSKPSSKKTVYLNFLGGRMVNNEWNIAFNKAVVDFKPFDIDGYPNSFSEQERLEIFKRWRYVADAFAQYDINVTTIKPSIDKIERSSLSDQEFGVISHITPNWTLETSNPCYCGGFAYLSAFNSLNNRIRENFNFNWADSSYAKGSSGTIIHEVGHNLGLLHDGSSSTSYYAGHGSGEKTWAPYMGNGYYSEVAQFSKGEYPDANNKEDDFAVMEQHEARRSPYSGFTVGFGQNTNTMGVDYGKIYGRGVMKSGDYKYHYIASVGAGRSTWALKNEDFSRNFHGSMKIINEDTGESLYDSSSAGNPRDLTAQLILTKNTLVRVTIENAGSDGTSSAAYTSYGSTGEFFFTGAFDYSYEDVYFFSKTGRYDAMGKMNTLIAQRVGASGDETYKWTFSDGKVLYGQEVMRSFGLPGKQEIVLEVSGKDGFKKRVSKTVNVSASTSMGANDVQNFAICYAGLAGCK